MKIKPGINYIAILLIAAIIGAITLINFIKRPYVESSESLKILGNLKLKGSVINSKVYKYGGREYRLVCVKLDDCNQNDLYILKEFCAIKIKNGIATMSVGGNQPYFHIDYVTLDASKNSETFHYQNGDTRKGEVYLGGGGLTETDMNYCQ